MKAARQKTALAAASPAGQVATFLQILVAAGLAGAWLDNATVFVVTAVALAGGIAIGLATPVGGYFINLSGVVVALCALCVVFVVHAATDARLFGDRAWLVFLAVALVPIGLDWRWVPRLRARTVCSGVFVLPLVGAHEGWALTGAVGWFVGALATLWVLERDVERAALRPVRLSTSEREPGLRGFDIVRTVGVGLALGLAIAMLVGDVSCTAPQRRGSGDSIGPTAGNSQPGGDSSSSSGSAASGSSGAGSSSAGGAAGGAAGDAGGSVTGGGTHASAPADPSGQLSPSGQSSSSGQWWFAGILLAVIVLAVVGLRVWRRRGRVAGRLDWPHRVAARLDEEGRRRGRGRGRGETVVDHATALADGPLRDERVAAAGRVVSAAMFGRREADDATRAWVDRVVDEATAANPPPRRRRRTVDSPA